MICIRFFVVLGPHCSFLCSPLPFRTDKISRKGQVFRSFMMIGFTGKLFWGVVKIWEFEGNLRCSKKWRTFREKSLKWVLSISRDYWVYLNITCKNFEIWKFWILNFEIWKFSPATGVIRLLISHPVRHFRLLSHPVPLLFNVPGQLWARLVHSWADSWEKKNERINFFISQHAGERIWDPGVFTIIIIFFPHWWLSYNKLSYLSTPTPVFSILSSSISCPRVSPRPPTIPTYASCVTSLYSSSPSSGRTIFCALSFLNWHRLSLCVSV